MIGPVQLGVLGFSKPDFRSEILAEFERSEKQFGRLKEQP